MVIRKDRLFYGRPSLYSLLPIAVSKKERIL